MTKQKGRAPAFPFYASDFLTDTLVWSEIEVAVHVRLLAWSWVNGGIPAAPELICRISPSAQAVWGVVGLKWQRNGEMFYNEQLEQIRKDSNEYRERQKQKSVLAHAAKQKSTAAPTGLFPQDADQNAPPKTPKAPDPGVQGVVEYLVEQLRFTGIAQSLDGSVKENRFAARSLLLKLKKDYPEHGALISAKTLIDASIDDPFHRKNTTNVPYLLKNCGKIIAAAKDRKSNPKTQTDADRKRDLAGELARRARVAAGQPA